MSEALIEGAFHVLAWNNLLLVCLGTALGIVFGAIPGLTATMGLALLVPFTFSMDPAGGLLMLAGIYVGAMYGDAIPAIPAILINTPGTPAAIATTFDGFPLARKGMAQHAMVTAAFASFVGSVLANIVLATSAEPLAEMSLRFGPPEYFWLGIFGLTIISVLSSGNLLKGFIAAAIGLLFSTVGMATLSGDVRLTFGYPELQGGIGLAGALIGFFCLPEILSNVIGRQREHYAGEPVRPSMSVIFETISDLVRRPVLMLRSSLIGLVVGVAPPAPAATSRAWSRTAKPPAGSATATSSARERFAASRRRQPAAEAPPTLPSDTGVNTDLVIGFVTIATALVAFVNTRELSRFGGLFVEHCMIALAVLGLVTVVKGFVRPERSAFFESSAERNRVMAGTGILAGYLFALPYLGFLVASICFYFVMQRSLRAEAAGARSLALAAVTSVAGVRGAVRAVSLHPAGAAADRRVGILNATAQFVPAATGAVQPDHHTE